MHIELRVRKRCPSCHRFTLAAEVEEQGEPKGVRRYRCGEPGCRCEWLEYRGELALTVHHRPLELKVSGW